VDIVGQGHRSKFKVTEVKMLLKWSVRPRIRALLVTTWTTLIDSNCVVEMVTSSINIRLITGMSKRKPTCVKIQYSGISLEL